VNTEVWATADEWIKIACPTTAAGWTNGIASFSWMKAKPLQRGTGQTVLWIRGRQVGGDQLSGDGSRTLE